MFQVTGQILQPSDLRLKDVCSELDSGSQLRNVKKLKIVKYQYKPEFLRQLPEDAQHQALSKERTGVIAQDVQKVIPEAVSTSGSCRLQNGETVEDVLIVDKDRLFLGNTPSPNYSFTFLLV